MAAETIVQEARRLMHLVENVLHFSRAERRQERLTLGPAPLAPLLRSALTAFAPVAEGARVRLRTSFDEEVVAMVDPHALRQIILNLLDNALKYGPAGQVVGVGVGHADGADDRGLLWVDDEGPGVAPEERERLWEPFVRGARDRGSGGSGIGLAVVRELARLMNGRAWVGDAPGGGARFAVELPLAPRGAAESVAAEPARIAAAWSAT